MTPSNLQILAHDDTPLGPLCLRRRELLSMPGTVVTEVTLDHAFLMSSLNTVSERALSRMGLEMHQGTDLRVLVGGLGLGYTAHEALTSPRVSNVLAMEFLPQVIEWLDRDLVPLAAELKRDTRFATTTGDVYALLAESPSELFDLILIDVDHAPDEPLSGGNGFFYTEAGLERAGRHLAPGGILGVWSYAENSAFARALREVFSEVRVEPIAFFNELVEEETTDWLFFARRSVDPSDRASDLQRLTSSKEALGILQGFTPDLIVLDLLMPELDDLGVLQSLQASDSHRHIPVVVVTAKDLSPSEIRHLSEEVQAVPRKGGELEADLRATIREIFTRRQQIASSAGASSDVESGPEP